MIAEMNKDLYKKCLSEGEVNITFTKANGELRKMRCTLNTKLIPEVQKEETSERKVNPDVQPVWDLDKQAWRSFRYDSVKEVSL